jgi:hypothetical protein
MSKDMWIADIGSHIAVLHKHGDKCGKISLVLIYGDERYYMPMTDVLKEMAKSYAKTVIRRES